MSFEIGLCFCVLLYFDMGLAGVGFDDLFIFILDVHDILHIAATFAARELASLA